MWPNPQETVDLVTFTEEILNGKLHFLCSDSNVNIKTLTTFAKSSTWDAWLCPKSASAGEYKTAFKIQAEISLWQMESFWSLGQLVVLA